MGTWIDVKQKLPEIGDRVLVWKTNADQEHIARYSPLGYPEFPWRDQFNGGDGPSISHWMPLPVPPNHKAEAPHVA